jgi:hypothetical protein
MSVGGSKRCGFSFIVWLHNLPAMPAGDHETGYSTIFHGFFLPGIKIGLFIFGSVCRIRMLLMKS